MVPFFSSFYEYTLIKHIISITIRTIVLIGLSCCCIRIVCCGCIWSGGGFCCHICRSCRSSRILNWQFRSIACSVWCSCISSCWWSKVVCDRMSLWRSQSFTSAFPSTSCTWTTMSSSSHHWYFFYFFLVFERILFYFKFIKYVITSWTLKFSMGDNSCATERSTCVLVGCYFLLTTQHHTYQAHL